MLEVENCGGAFEDSVIYIILTLFIPTDKAQYTSKLNMEFAFECIVFTCLKQMG